MPTQLGPGANSSQKIIRRRNAALRKAVAAAVTVTGLSCACLSARAATVTSTWRAGATGNWNDATKWTNSPSAATFPNNGNLSNTYDVVLNSGTATLNVPVSIHNLTLGGGWIQQPAAPAGTNAISLTGNFTFNGGLLDVPVTVPSGGTFTVGTGTLRLGAALSTAGPVAFAGAGPYRVTAADPRTAWAMQSSGTLTLDRTLILDAPPRDPFGQPDGGLFDNYGTITTTAATGGAAALNAEDFWAVRNFGTLRVGSAFDLKAYGFSSSGLIDLTSSSSVLNVYNFNIFDTHLEGVGVRIAAGARLNFASGGVELKSASWTNNGTVNFNGQLHVIAPSTVPGTLTFATNTAGILADAPLTMTGPVTFDAGVIAGTNRVTASNLTFKAGGIRDAELFVPAGGTLTFSGTASRTIQRLGRLTVDGTLNWTGGGLTADSVTNRVSVSPGATLNVSPSVTATLDSTPYRTGAFDHLANAGLVNVGSGTLSLGPTWSLDNSGTVRVTAGGALALSTASLTGGTVELQAGASATFTATSSATVSIAPAGLLDVRASATASFAGSFPGLGRIANSGVINVAGGLAVNDRWTLENSGTVRVSAATAQLAGTLTNTGAIAVTSAGLQVTSLRVTNAGRIDLGVGASMTVVPPTNAPAPAFQNLAGGVLNVGPGATASFAGTYPNTLTNAGDVIVDHAQLTVGSEWAFSNTGKVTVSMGALKFDSAANFTPYTNTGSIDLRGGGGLVVARPTSFATDTAQTLNTVRGQVLASYHGGAWDGPGVRSASAAADPTTAVGYALATGPGTFLGVPVAAGDILVRHTKSGDANVDGAVNFADLLALAKNYNATNAHWYQGDFTYDGAVNFADLLVLAKNYNSTIPAADALPGAPAGFTGDLAAAFAQVPEPSAALLATAACGFVLTARRRRRTGAARS